MEKTQDVEKLLRRIQHLEDALKLKLINISRLKEEEEEEEEDTLYFNILDSINAPIHITDAKGYIIYRNPAWAKLYGYSAAESLGKHTNELTVRPQDAAIANNILDQILKKGAIHGGEFVTRNKKGERFLAFGCSSPLRDQNGLIIGLTCISIIPTPIPELTSEPQVCAPTTTHPSQVDKSKLQQVNNTPKPEWMGVSWPKEGAAARSLWHWVFHTDQEHEKMISFIQPQALCKWSSHFDKVYEIKWEDLLIRERIGRGSYGILYHAVWYGSDVALKLFPKHDFILPFMQEVSVMKRLRHPNILLFMGAVVSPQHVCIVTEFLCRGSLFQLIHRRRIRFNLKHHVHMALDIAQGMNYLHCCHPPIIHCDLKSSNLRVDKNWRVKICDFGLCHPKHETKEGIGSPEWMAPEVLRNEEAGEKSDVYSYGVVLWEMTTEQIPWDGLTSVQVIEAVGFMNQRLKIPKDDVDPQWASLIERCLCSEAESRPIFQQILEELKELQKNVSLQLHNSLGL